MYGGRVVPYAKYAGEEVMFVLCLHHFGTYLTRVTFAKTFTSSVS